jgi:hypothetical protein
MTKYTECNSEPAINSGSVIIMVLCSVRNTKCVSSKHLSGPRR